MTPPTAASMREEAKLSIIWTVTVLTFRDRVVSRSDGLLQKRYSTRHVGQSRKREGLACCRSIASRKRASCCGPPTPTLSAATRIGTRLGFRVCSGEPVIRLRKIGVADFSGLTSPGALFAGTSAILGDKSPSGSFGDVPEMESPPLPLETAGFFTSEKTER
jgi:hypothetical protein